MKPRYRLLLELLSALALFGMVTAVTARTQHHTTVFSGHGWDGRFYYSVAEQFAQGKKPVSFAPYVYRIGTPFLAALFSPSDVMKGFYIANIAAAGLIVILLVVWLRMFIESWLVRAILLALFIVQWHAPTRFVFFIANGTDAWAMLFCLAGLICIEKLRVKMTRGVFVLLCLIALIGPFFREFAAIVGLAFAFVANPIRYDHGFKIRRLTLLWAVPFGLSFAGVLASHVAVGRISSSYSFIGQLLFTGYHQPIFMYLHAWLMAYGPVLFLLIFGWRLVGRFLGEHQSLLVFLACIAGLSWVGGDDTERFALWTMPIIYVLCGKVMEDNFALLRSAPLLAFMAATQAISARVFWAIPDEWGGKDPSLVFLTPFRNASYLNLYSHYAPKMALSFAEYCFVGMILLGWIYLRSIRQGDGLRAHFIATWKSLWFGETGSIPAVANGATFGGLSAATRVSGPESHVTRQVKWQQ